MVRKLTAVPWVECRWAREWHGDSPMNDEDQIDSPAAEEPVISEQEAQMALDVLRSEQKLIPATLAGIVAAMIGGGIWATVTIVTEYQIGWMAIGIGFLVGFTVRIVGKGIDQTFGAVSAVLSLFGCMVGNVLTVAYFVAVNEGMEFMDVVSQLDFALTYELLVSTFQIMDVLFYGLAAYFGYRYAFREITQDDFKRVLGKSF